MKIFVTTLIATVCVCSAAAQFTTNGSAVFYGEGLIRISESGNTPQTASVFSDDKIDLSQGFDMEFQMFFGCDNGENGGDGMTFVLQNDPRGKDAIGASYGELGYGGPGGTAIKPSVAIEFDTFNGSATDIDADHTGVLLNGDVLNHFPSPVNVGTDLEDCRELAADYWVMRMVWDPNAQTLSQYINGTLQFSYNSDIINAIFGGTTQVYWGFTGATGFASNEQWISPVGSIIPWQCKTNSCCESYTVEIDGPGAICGGSPATLTVVGDYETIEWSTGETTKSITVTEPGNYSVSVLQDQAGVTCPGFAEKRILDLPAIDVVDGTFCNSAATLSVANPGSYDWYNADGEWVGSGTEFTTPVFTSEDQDQTYFVAEAAGGQLTAGGAMSNFGSNVYSGEEYHNTAEDTRLDFSTTENMIINTIDVEVNFWPVCTSSNVVLNLRAANGNVLQSFTHTVSCPGSPPYRQSVTVPVQFVLEAGQSYSIDAGGSSNLIITYPWLGNYPIDQEQIMLTGAATASRFPSFMNWDITLGFGLECLMPVVAVKTCPNCVAPENPTISPVGASFCGTGSQVLTVTIDNDAAATFGYTFYRSGTPDVVVQELSASNTYTADQSGTYYAVAANMDDPTTCSATSENAVIEIFDVPTADLQGTTSICESESADLTFLLTGTGPFEVIYNDGTQDVTLTGISDGYVETVTPTATTAYSLVSVTDANTPGCSTDENAQVTITLTPNLSYSAVQYACDMSKEFYTASFSIVDAVEGSFTVVGADQNNNEYTGTLTGLDFVSGQIPNGEMITFSIAPTSSCAPVEVEVQQFCDCETVVGTMATESLSYCANDQVVAVHNGDEDLDPNDIMMYALHDGDGMSLGNVIATNNTPSFAYDVSMAFNQTYYVSAVAGNDLGDNVTVDVDNDHCAQVAIGQPVMFNETPLATISGDAGICVGSEVEISISLVGASPFDFSYTDGTETVEVTAFAESEYTVTMSPAGTTTYELVQLSDGSNAGCTGVVDGQAQIDVLGELELEIIAVNPTCAGACNGLLGAQVDAENEDLVGSNGYTWFNESGEVISNSQLIQGLALCEGTYRVVADNGSCSASQSIELVDPEVITVSVDNFTHPTCAGYSDGTATVSATGGTIADDYQFNWSAGSEVAAPINLGKGVHMVTVTDDNNCIGTASVELLDPAEIVVVIDDFDRVVCVDGAAVLSATATGGTGSNYSFVWTNDQTAAISTEATMSTPISTGTTFTVVAYDGNSCPSSSVSELVQTFGVVEIGAGISDTDICEGESVLINHDGGSGGDGNYKITWSSSDVSAVLNDEPNQQVNPTNAVNTYTAQITDGCDQSATSSVVVVAHPTPATSFGYNAIVECEQVTLEVFNTTLGLVGNETCLWNFVDHQVVSTDCQTAQNDYQNNGEHVVEFSIISEFGCTGSAQLDTTLNKFPNPEVAFSYSPIKLSMENAYANFDPIDLTASTQMEWYWDFGDGNTSSETSPDNEFPSLDTGRYEVELIGINEYGCHDTSLQTIPIFGDYHIYAPTAFTPNGDGTNDVFNLKAVGISEVGYDLIIVDRWGEQIFISDRPNQGWDGTVKNSTEQAKQDVYTWVMRGNTAYTETNMEITRTGRVTVMR